MAGQTTRLDHVAPDHAEAPPDGLQSGTAVRNAGWVPEPVDLSSHRRPRALRLGRLCERHLAGELAPERLLAWQFARSQRRGGSSTSPPREAAQLVAALLDANRGGSARRRTRLSRPAPPARSDRHRGRAGEVSLYPGIKAHSGRVYGH